MKSYDYDAVTYDHDVFCVKCLPPGIDVESDDVCPIFADSEWEYYPICCVCGGIHDYVSLIGVARDGKPVKTEDKPILFLTGGETRRTAKCDTGLDWIEFEVDFFAGETYTTCILCETVIDAGWLCLDGGEEYCEDCVIIADDLEFTEDKIKILAAAAKITGQSVMPFLSYEVWNEIDGGKYSKMLVNGSDVMR